MRNLLLICLLFPVYLFAQPYRNIQIDVDKYWKGPEEPAICISSKDTNVIMAAANIRTTYVSTDGGLTWKKKFMNSPYGVYGDPCLISTNKGKFLYFHLSLPKGRPYVDPSFLDRIVCQSSKRKPHKFNKGSYMGLTPPKDQDKEWAVYDRERERTYVTWTQFDEYGSKDTTDRSVILASYSDNDGKTWSEPVVMSHISGNCIDGDSTTEGAVPAIGLNGEMHVAWAVNERIYFNTFMPGDSVKKEVLIAAQPGGWDQDIEGLNRTNGMPVTVSDMSQGPFRGNIYVSWSDQRNGELNTDVFIKRSTDGGKTWSSAIRVNDDQTHTHQFLPWMTIDQSTGYVYILFYDRRNYVDALTDVYLAVSKDGGLTFKNVRISESPFAPRPNVFFGDYINISVEQGVVRPIWTRYENGELSIWTAIVTDI